MMCFHHEEHYFGSTGGSWDELSPWASPSVGRINILSLDDITRKEARDSMHITPGRRLQDSVTESTSSMTRSDHNGFGILKSSWQGFFRFITTYQEFFWIFPEARSFLERCVSASSENHLHRRAISWRRLAFSIVIFCTSTPVQRIFIEELCYDNIISILLNLATTWVSCPYWKNKNFGYDNIILRGKAENQRKYTPLMFDQNEKKKNCYIWSSSDSYTLERKKIKPITMLRRLVGNHGSLSNMNLKYHVSILMQGLYSNSIMCLVMKPLAFPLVEWFLSYVVS